MKNSIAPERTWLSMSVSQPSWLFGKTWISTRPLVSCLMRSIASMARTLSGCVTGELLAYLSWEFRRALGDPWHRRWSRSRRCRRAAGYDGLSEASLQFLRLVLFGPSATGFELRPVRPLGLIMGGHRTPGKWRCVIKSEGNGPCCGRWPQQP